MNIKKFIRAMQNTLRNNESGFYIYKIDESVHTSYDPEEDTILMGFYKTIQDIPAELLESEIQDFYIESDLSAISFYI